MRPATETGADPDSRRGALPDGATLLREIRRVARADERLAGAERTGSLVLERFLRLPGERRGARYRAEPAGAIPFATNGFVHVRCGAGEARAAADAIPLPALDLELLPMRSDPALPGIDALMAGGAQPVAWRPGRRAVLREDRSGGTRYWKVLDEKAFARRDALFACEEMAELGAAGLLLPVERSASLRAFAFHAARGTRVHDRLAAGLDLGARSVAESLRRLRESARRLVASGRLPSFGTRDELAALDRALDFALEVRPELSGPFARLRERIAEPSDRGPLGFLHRDLHDLQLFVGGDRADDFTLVDADTLAAGPLALDGCNLAAHLWLRERQGASPRGGELARALLAALGLDPRAAGSAARFFLATSLLRLAGVYAVRPAEDVVVPALLRATESVLERGALA